MYVERHVVEVTTDASGGAIAHTPNVTGEISAIRYVKTDFDNAVDFTITLESTGESLLSKSNVAASTSWYPRAVTSKIDSLDAEFASGYPVALAPFRCANDRVKIVVTDGGAAKTGTFHIVIA